MRTHRLNVHKETQVVMVTGRDNFLSYIPSTQFLVFRSIWGFWNWFPVPKNLGFDTKTMSLAHFSMFYVPEHWTVILGSTTVPFQACFQLLPTSSGQAKFPSWRMNPKIGVPWSLTFFPIVSSITHLAGDSARKKRYISLDFALYTGFSLYIEWKL